VLAKGTELHLLVAMAGRKAGHWPTQYPTEGNRDTTAATAAVVSGSIRCNSEASVRPWINSMAAPPATAQSLDRARPRQ
jgi:hypothetical protein